MTNKQKRETVVSKVKGREGKNQYTQSANRTKVASGYSDCSSLPQWAYQQVGVVIGSYTGAQIDKGEWVTQGGAHPNAALLLPGDLVFFSAYTNNGRKYNVGHVEVYVGNGQLSGHGSGVGPTRKNMIDYCKQRNAGGGKYIGVKRYIKKDASDGVTPSPSTPSKGNDADYVVQKGDNLSTIANKLKVTIDELVALNNIVDKNKIAVGQVIKYVLGAWKRDSKGWWWKHANGTYPTNSWQQIGGSWYYFDGDGYLKTGWLKEGGEYYYLEETGDNQGRMWIGWIKVKDKWYLLGANGAMQTGWQEDNGVWYYLENDGSMARSTWIDNHYVGEDGKWISDYKA